MVGAGGVRNDLVAQDNIINIFKTFRNSFRLYQTHRYQKKSVLDALRINDFERQINDENYFVYLDINELPLVNLDTDSEYIINDDNTFIGGVQHFYNIDLVSQGSFNLNNQRLSVSGPSGNTNLNLGPFLKNIDKRYTTITFKIEIFNPSDDLIDNFSGRIMTPDLTYFSIPYTEPFMGGGIGTMISIADSGQRYFQSEITMSIDPLYTGDYMSEFWLRLQKTSPQESDPTDVPLYNNIGVPQNIFKISYRGTTL